MHGALCLALAGVAGVGVRAGHGPCGARVQAVAWAQAKDAAEQAAAEQAEAELMQQRPSSKVHQERIDDLRGHASRLLAVRLLALEDVDEAQLLQDLAVVRLHQVLGPRLRRRLRARIAG